MGKTLYPLGSGPAITTSTSSFSAATSSTLAIANVGSIPTAPNHITIYDSTTFVTLSYSSISGNTLTISGVVAGDNTHTFDEGSSVVRTIDGYDFEAIHENLMERVTLSQNSQTFALGRDDGGVYIDM